MNKKRFCLYACKLFQGAHIRISAYGCYSNYYASGSDRANMCILESLTGIKLAAIIQQIKQKKRGSKEKNFLTPSLAVIQACFR